MEAGRGNSLTLEQRNSIQIVSGSAHRELAVDAARAITPAGYVYPDLDPTKNGRFKNTELDLQYIDSVRGKHVIILQSMIARSGFSVNDALIEAGLMAQAANLASASEVTVFAPVFPYARQDRKDDGRVPLSARFAIDTLAIAGGARRLVAVDVHSHQIQLGHGGPFDLVPAMPLFVDALREQMGDGSPEDYVVVAPDEGAVKTAGKYAKALGGLAVTFIPKNRSEDDRSVLRSIGIQKELVEGKHCFVPDDMIDSGRTLVTAAQALKDAGAASVTVAATHGLFSQAGDRVLAKSRIDKIIVTNTSPQKEPQRVLGKRLQVLDIAPMIGEAIYNIVTHGSVSNMHKY